MLDRLLPSPDTDALLGDIVEERKQRSPPWYRVQRLAVLAPRPTDSQLIFAVRLIHFVSIPAAILVGGYWSTGRVHTA